MTTVMDLSNALAGAVERASGAVLAVHGRPRLPSTGVRWRAGLVVTANHTVEADREVTLTGPDGRTLSAQVAGRDPRLDIAVLRTDAESAPAAEVADDGGGHGSRSPRAYLGAGTQAVVLPDPLRERLHLAQRTAVIAVNVKPDSPAAVAGLIIGDVIVSVAGHAIAEPEDLMAVLRPDRVGRAVTLSILRGGEPRDVEVIVGERPQRA